MITAKINVLKIDKSKLFEGAKGTYLDVVLLESTNNEYGDYVIVQATTKEEREAGVKGAILGNAKKVGSQTAYPKSQPEQQPSKEDDDLPF